MLQIFPSDSLWFLANVILLLLAASWILIPIFGLYLLYRFVKAFERRK